VKYDDDDPENPLDDQQWFGTIAEWIKRSALVVICVPCYPRCAGL